MVFYNKDWVFFTMDEFLPLIWKFTVKNLKKIQSINMNLWNAKRLPDTIKHYKKVWWWLIKVPNWIRSFLDIEDRYWEIINISHPTLNNEFEWNDLDIMQNEAINKLLQKDTWLLLASTSAGKTIICAKIINQLKVKTLIIVSNLILMQQMKKDFEVFFWVTCKTISWNKTKQKWSYENIIIWNIDSVRRLDKSYLDTFDLILVDEVDQCWLTAEARLEFIWSIFPKYLYWMSWTVKLNHVDNSVFPIYIWKQTDLIIKHFTPKIFKVLTWFTYFLDDIKEFHKLKEALYFNEERNDLIIETIIWNIHGRKWIVFTEYIEHAKLIKEKLEQRWVKCFLLIWEITKDEREKIKKEIIEYGWDCVLIGSVKIIWRGFSISELSIWFLTTCEKFTSNISQFVWRIIRLFPWKTDCIFFDFVDENSPILYNQSRSRNSTYKREFPWCNINIY